MSLLDIILLAISLAMDCFTISIVSGSILRRWHGTVIVRIAVLFGLFQALMPLIGWTAMHLFAARVEAYGHWIAFGMLLFIGGRMIWESLRGSGDEPSFRPEKLTTQLLLAVATSIDALAVGISFACTGYTSVGQLTLPLIIIGAVSFLFSLIGYQVGARFGKSASQRLKPELLGGVILILIGVKILASHLLAETI